MNKFKYYFILIITSISLFSCSKDSNSAEVALPRDYAAQYATEIVDIEAYLKAYYIDFSDPNFADKDVEILKITDAATQPSIWSYLNKTTFPKLLSKDVKLHDITYNLYYLVLREGTGESPSNADAVLTAYKGEYLTSKTEAGVTTITPTFFEQNNNPQQFFKLLNVITGWNEVFPMFKKGNYVSNSNGTVSFSDFGAGVMFIPSGLGYYNAGQGSIPSYSPLVFSFKLFEIQRLDQDGDGIPSYLEDVNGDNFMRNLAVGVVNPDDTDGDGFPNFLDVDDDGDNYTTRFEITGSNGVLTPFINIPDCSGNITNTTRVRKHLDKNCH
jgi:hypothetical protein